MLQVLVAGNVRSMTVLAGPSFLKRRPLPHNNSFKPNPLRYSHNMAEKACHVVASTTQVGLIRTLGPSRVNDNPYSPPKSSEPPLLVDHWMYLRAFFITFLAASASIVCIYLIAERYYYGDGVTDARRLVYILLRAPLIAVGPGIIGAFFARLHWTFFCIFGVVSGPVVGRIVIWYFAGS